VPSWAIGNFEKRRAITIKQAATRVKQQKNSVACRRKIKYFKFAIDLSPGQRSR